MVDVKKFNESNLDFLRNTGIVAVDSAFEYLYPSKSNLDKSSKLVTLFWIIHLAIRPLAFLA